MTDCLFCKIIAGKIPGKIIYNDEKIVAFMDNNPQAPLHALVLPRRHIATLNDLEPGDEGLIGGIIRRGATIAKQHGYDAKGYRTVFNCNADAGQSVLHIHLHVLGGRKFSWPPG